VGRCITIDLAASFLEEMVVESNFGFGEGNEDICLLGSDQR
jgi:hypothetical protein